ncbi:MAG: HAD family hydrolase [Pyruvatibacter sp.]
MQTMTVTPTILFDLDGTLADTALDLTETMNVVLAKHGRARVPHERVREMVGGGARKIMERGFTYTGEPASEELLDQLFEEFLDYYGDHLADHTQIFDGLVTALETLEQRGYKLGVVTNKVEGLSLEVIKLLGLDRFFPVLIGGDTLPVRKPDPTPIFEAVSRLKGDRASTVMVGDSPFDIDAAKNAGVGSIAVSFGYTDVPPAEMGADRLIDHYDEFLPALDSLLAELQSAQ